MHRLCNDHLHVLSIVVYSANTVWVYVEVTYNGLRTGQKALEPVN